jgi:hypothetical protein
LQSTTFFAFWYTCLVPEGAGPPGCLATSSVAPGRG